MDTIALTHTKALHDEISRYCVNLYQNHSDITDLQELLAIRMRLNVMARKLLITCSTIDEDVELAVHKLKSCNTNTDAVKLKTI